MSVNPVNSDLALSVQTRFECEEIYKVAQHNVQLGKSRNNWMQVQTEQRRA